MNTGNDPAYWFALLRAPCHRRHQLTALLKKFHSPEKIFHASKQELSACGLGGKTLEYFHNPDWTGVESDLKWLEESGNFLITIEDEYYPGLLKQIYDPPPAYCLRGDPASLNRIQLSIVGSRRPSADGRRIARSFSTQLAELGFTITSGLATGLDSEAHRGALKAGKKTVAVLGSGVDYIYPASNKGLAEMIMDSGAVISEFPLGSTPLPVNFPQRNRIISGLSPGTIVIEAALKSGSLITARCAVEQGREVFAVPGSIYNRQSRGCHFLIREGAKLVECVDDILEELGPLSIMSAPERQVPDDGIKKIKKLDADCKLLLDNIGKHPVTVDMLVEETGMSVVSVTMALLTLELEGLVDSVPGGEYTRRR